MTREEAIEILRKLPIGKEEASAQLKYYPAAYHIYHDTKRRLVCSWGCMRKSEKERKDTRGA